MKTTSEFLKKFILIGLSLFAYKSVLIVLAYALNQGQYNIFNQAYYTASILILFGSLGFDIAQTRIPVSKRMIFLFVSANIIITYIMLHLFSHPFTNYYEIFPIVIYSIFISAGGILNFKLLFDGNYKKYFLILLLLTVMHLMIIPGIIYLHISIFLLLSLCGILWFISAYWLFDTKISNNIRIIDYYSIGFSAFIINSAVSLGLAADKFIVNHYFNTDIANSYTFAWGLTAPIFYIGTLIEKYLFAEKNPEKSKILKKGFILSLTLVICYSAGILSIINFYPSLLPLSISKEIFHNIFIFMITGYSVYVILHFPINTYLFKVLDVKKQKTISVYFTLIILFFILVFYYLINSNTSFTYQILLITVWIYIFTLLTIKTIIMFRKKNSEVKGLLFNVQDSLKDLP